MEEYDKKTNAKLEEEYKKKMDNAKVIKNQLVEFKHNHIKKIKDEMLEGELLKRKVRDEQEKERIKDQIRLEAQRKAREDFKRANEELKVYNEELKKKEDEEMKIIEKYATKKEYMEQLRKDKE